MKIAIIGNGGSGKTTLGFQLQKKLNIPLYHLDQYYWEPHWQRKNAYDFTIIHTQLCNTDSWIIEGANHKYLPNRLKYADIIIFLDTPRFTCIWRALKRSVKHRGEIIPGSPQGCPQRILHHGFFTFLKWIWSYNKINRPTVIQLLNEVRINHNKKIYILQSPSAIAQFLDQFCT